MKLNKPTILLAKIISIILISSAIICELCSAYILVNNYESHNYLRFLLWISRCALIIHFIESLIVVYYIRLENKSYKNYVKYGIYSFLVGTVSLLELKKNRNKV